MVFNKDRSKTTRFVDISIANIELISNITYKLVEAKS